MSDTPATTEFEAAFAEAVNSTAATLDTELAPDGQDGKAADDLTPLEPGASEPLSDPAPVIEDIWSNATDEQRAAFNAAQGEADKYKHRVASDDGRVARFQRERDEAKRALGTLKSVSQMENMSDYLKSDEWLKTKTDYGDDLKPIFNLVETLAQHNQQISDRFGLMDDEDAEAFEAQQVSILTERASDWKELLGSEDFSPWLTTQPVHVQEAFSRNFQKITDVDQAVDVVDRFRASRIVEPQPQPDQQQLDQKRAAQLEASKSAKSKSPAVADQADSFDAFFKQRAAQQERQRAAHR